MKRKFNKLIIKTFMLLVLFGCIIYGIYKYYVVYQSELKEIKLINTLIELNDMEDVVIYQNQHNQINDKSDSLSKKEDFETLYKGKIKNKDYKNDEQYNKNDNLTNLNENDLNEVDSILHIPKINLNKFVYNGSRRKKHLDSYQLITATNDMKFKNGGNYIICGHTSRIYGYSLNRLKELDINDQIIMIDKNFIQTKYNIVSVDYINMFESNQYAKQSKNNIITIISCAKIKSKDYYIVVKAIPV